jgi:long-subunit fatty acid transport protein
MKKFILLAIFAFSATLSAYAQFSGGLGINYGTQIDKIGITGKGTYSLNDNIELSGNFTYFLPYKYFTSYTNNGYTFKTTITESIRTLNLDIHYNFRMSDKLDVYPYLGANTTQVKITLESEIKYNSDSDTKSDTKTVYEPGLNIGVGGGYKLSESLKGFGEIKYVVSDYDQFNFTLGLLYLF